VKERETEKDRKIYGGRGTHSTVSGAKTDFSTKIHKIWKMSRAQVTVHRIRAVDPEGYSLYFKRTFAYETYYYGIYFYEIYFYGSILLRREYTSP
jgi:hypothetical protein